MLTSTDILTNAHDSTFCLAKRAAAVLAANEGLGATLSKTDISRLMGVDLQEVSSLDALIMHTAIDAGLMHRGWSEVPSDGTTKRYTKKPAVRHYRKPAEPPVARARARANTVR